jgi:hypothetical protein
MSDTLSSKMYVNIKMAKGKGVYFHIDDVREAVKKLKEELCSCNKEEDPSYTCALCVELEEIFGEGLINGN